jgi:glycosyltransferase involved in cell wall biosynthesis
MKILFVAPRFHTNQYQMVKTLQENKHEVIFHVASLGITEDYTLLTPFRFSQSKVSLLIEKLIGKVGVNRPNYFPNPFKYWRIFKKLKPEVVIIRDPYKFFSLMAATYALFTRSRIVFYTQEEIFRTRRKRSRMNQNLIIRLFKAAWMTPTKCDNREENNRLAHMYHIPLPIPITTTIHNRHIIPEEGPRILMVGKYHQERKNHLLFIKAVNNLKDKYKFKVTIVGECIRDSQLVKFEEINEVVQKLGLSKIIELKKNIPYNKMDELYDTHHFFVLPAKDEQYAVSVTEALGHGLPAICTDTNGARGNIMNGKNGFIVKSDSLEELTNAMEALISSKERIQEMSEKAMDYVRENLTGGRFYENFLHLLKDRFNLVYN